MNVFTRAELEAASELVYGIMQPTPQYVWPLLAKRTGAEVWVKHENHTPTGAFKVRGGLVYFDWLSHTHPEITDVVAATRGNHGQSVPFAASRHRIRTRVFAPTSNSREKNAAMRAWGAELILHGEGFDEALAEARRVAEDEGAWFMPSYDPMLARGVATYALELFTAVRDLETVYVPIGLGSGVCGLITTRDLLGLKTEIVGVVSQNAPCYALSVDAGHVVATENATTIADGVAVRTPDAEALASDCAWCGSDCSSQRN